MPFKLIRFVTDSTCDIPADLARTYRIGVVPCYINFGGQSYRDDGVEITREYFYNQMPHIRPYATTAAPPPGLAEQIIRETFEGADHLIMVSAPAKLSAIYNSLRLGASNLPPERVTQLDSGTTSMALGWQVLAGAEVAATTGDVGAAVRAIEAVKAHGNLYAALPTLDYLQHSGRVSWAAANIGALLQIKPIIDVKHGEVKSVARVRTFARAMDELAALARQYAPLDKLAILHTNNLEGAQALKERMSDIVPADTLLVNATPVLGAYAGPGALGVAPVSKSWRT